MYAKLGHVCMGLNNLLVSEKQIRNISGPIHCKEDGE